MPTEPSVFAPLMIPASILIVSTALLPLQYYIWKHPQLFRSKIFALIIYLMGIGLAILGLDLAEEIAGASGGGAERLFLGIAFGIIFTMQFLLTYEVSKGKPIGKSFWIKSIIGFIVAQIALQLIMYFDLIHIRL